MKYRILGIVVSVCLICSSTSATSLKIGTWQATGYENWRTSFPISAADKNHNGASELFYPHSGRYVTASYDNKIDTHYKLRVEGGLMGKITPSSGSDSDWDYRQKTTEQFYGQFTTTGLSSFVNIDFAKELNKNTELFYGYGYRYNKFNMQNGIYTIWNYETVNSIYNDLDSYYTIVYQGLHIGFTTQRTLASKLSVTSTLSYSPLAVAQGYGWWNLRDLNFKHQAPAKMLDAIIGFNWSPDAHMVITAGYRYSHMSISKGWESLSSSVSWDKATHVQKGIFVTSTTKF